MASKACWGGSELHRRLSVALTGIADLEGALCEVHQAIDWYEVADGRRLSLVLHATQGSRAVLRELSLLVEAARARNNGWKNDPAFTIALPAVTLTDEVLGAIEQLDVRSPRMTVLAAWSDAESFAGLERDLDAAVSRLHRQDIAIQPMFVLSHDWASLGALHAWLARLEAETTARSRFVFSRFPLVEAPWIGRCSDLERFVTELVEIWSAFPGLNESVAASTGGAFREFYRVKELWAVEDPRVIGFDGARAARARDPVEERQARFRQEVVRRLVAEPGLYARCRRSTNRVVLENDWDFAFDSYECQSPVFLVQAPAGSSSSRSDASSAAQPLAPST